MLPGSPGFPAPFGAFNFNGSKDAKVPLDLIVDNAGKVALRVHTLLGHGGVLPRSLPKSESHFTKIRIIFYQNPNGDSNTKY